MNDVLKTLDLRRSTRKYLDKEISDSDKQTILEAIINAPTAGNMVLYNIIDVTDEAKKEKLSVLCDDQPFIKNASMVLMFVSGAYRWYKAYNEINNTNLKPALADYYLAMADAHIAAQNGVIAAESLNIGSCYIGDIVENYEEIKKIFNLPKYVNPLCLLVFGYKDKDTVSQRPLRFNVADIVSENEYDDNSYEAFVNKFNYLDDLELQKKKADTIINGTFRRKQNAKFFKEMNRSLKLMIDEYTNE